MAPEQWRGSASVDHRADIYSLGVVLYELLTGKLPVGTYGPASHSAGVPVGIDRVVHRSLEQEPDRRYQSAREVQHDIEHESKGMAAAAAGASAPAPKSAAGARELVARGWLLLTAAAVVFFVSSFGMTLFFGAQQQRYIHSEIATHEALANEHTLRSMRETISHGKAWTGPLPSQVEFDIVDEVAPALRWSLFAGWGLSTMVLVILLLVAAARCAGAHARSRPQSLLIGMMACAPIAVPIDIWLFVLAGHGNQLAQVLAGGFVLLSNLTVVLWLWQRTAALQPVAAPATSFGFRAVAVGALVLMLGSAAGGGVVHFTTAKSAKVVARAPMRATELNGKTRTEVLDLLGPPVSVLASASSMMWTYYGLDGALVQDALTLQADRVIATSGELALLLPERLPEGSVHLGMNASNLAALLGAAVTKSQSQVTTELTYGDGTVITTSEGIVVGIQAR